MDVMGFEEGAMSPFRKVGHSPSNSDPLSPTAIGLLKRRPKAKEEFKL
jgi:hypothetical protein